MLRAAAGTRLLPLLSGGIRGAAGPNLPQTNMAQPSPAQLTAAAPASNQAVEPSCPPPAAPGQQVDLEAAAQEQPPQGSCRPAWKRGAAVSVCAGGGIGLLQLFRWIFAG